MSRKIFLSLKNIVREEESWLLVSYSVQAAVTEGHRLRALNNRNLFSSRPEGWLSEIKELANSDSIPSESTLPGLMYK